MKRRVWGAVLAAALTAATGILGIFLAMPVSHVWDWGLLGAAVVIALVGYLAANGKEPAPDERSGPARTVTQITNKLVFRSNIVNNITNLVAPDPENSRWELNAFTDYIDFLNKALQARLAAGLDLAVARIYGGSGELSLTFESRPRRVKAPGFTPFGIDDCELDPAWSAMKVFDIAHRSMLLLGDSGSGKSATLLHIVGEYAARAIDTDAASAEPPVPVWLSLRSWAAEPYKSLEAWLRSALTREFGVRAEMTAQWMAAGRLVLFFDGFGELEQRHRATCADAVNQFLRDQPQHGIMICAREAEAALVGRMSLNAAVAIRPLPRNAAHDYLLSLGPQAAKLLIRFDSDEQLRALLRTPFMLCVTAVAYAKDETEKLDAKGFRFSRYRVLEAYVDRLLSGNQSPDDKAKHRQNAKRRLTYLARRMVENGWNEIWEIPEVGLISNSLLRRTMRIVPPVFTGIFAASSAGFAVYIFLGNVAGLIAAGFMLTGYVMVFAYVLDRGMPTVSHMADTKLVLDTGKMLRRGTLARTVPVALFAVIATGFLAGRMGWSPQAQWQEAASWNRTAFWICMALLILLAPATILSGGLKTVKVNREFLSDFTASTIHVNLRITTQLVELTVKSIKAVMKWLLILFPIFFVLRFGLYWIAVTKYDQLQALPVAGGFIDHYVGLDSMSFFHALFADPPAGASIGQPLTWPLLVSGTFALAIGMLNMSFYAALGIEWTLSRYLLVMQDQIDPDFAGFLQYATRLSVLRMAGGGYEFYHSELRDYFAAGVDPNV